MTAINDKVSSNDERTVYFDYLRVLATFAVIILHVAAQNWHSTDVSSYEWQVFNIYDSIVRWAVPIFVMISGALFLDRDISTKKIYSKYILRLFTAFVIWSIIYVLAIEIPHTNVIARLIRGHYHMWFVLMMIGLYSCIPILRPVAKSDKLTQYFLLLAFLFASVCPTVSTLANDFGGELVQKGVRELVRAAGRMRMETVLGYSGYYILGYYLHKIQLTKKQRYVIYLLGIIGAVLAVVLDSIVAVQTQKPCSNYYRASHINILCLSISVFVLFKNIDWRQGRIQTIISKLARYSFGAYLVHILVIKQLSSFGLNTLSFNALISVPAIGVLVFVLSFAISALLNNIPVVKKYMV